MKIKTSDLSGAHLNAAVAQAEGLAYRIAGHPKYPMDGYLLCWLEDGNAFAPCADWRNGGWIIERERIHLEPFLDEWMAFVRHDGLGEPLEDSHLRQFGDSPLVAAMRAYVAEKFGEFVELK